MAGFGSNIYQYQLKLDDQYNDGTRIPYLYVCVSRATTFTTNKSCITFSYKENDFDYCRTLLKDRSGKDIF